MIPALLVLSAVCFLLLGVLIFVQDRARLTNQLFASICLCFIVWSVAILVFLTTSSESIAVVASKIFYIAAALFSALLFVFASIFPRDDKTTLGTKLLVFGVGLALIVAILILPDFVVGRVIIAPDGFNSIAVEPISYMIYSAYFIAVFTVGIYIAISKFIENKGDIRMQSGLYAFGLVINSIPGLVTNLILPYYGHYEYIWIGPVASVFFLVFATYGIVRHSLFDVKLAAVRSAAYVLALMSLSLIYYFLGYLASITLFKGDSSSLVDMSPINVGIALVLAFLFQPIKEFFDKVTNKAFYRDRYDLGDFSARFNRALSTTTDLRWLLKRAAEEIGDTLKSELAFLYVQQGATQHISSGTTKHSYLTASEVKQLGGYAADQGVDVVVASMVPNNHDVRRLLGRRKIAIVMPLVRDGSTFGCLALGERRSGGYARRDIKAIVMIADPLMIAIQNALSVQEVKDLNESLQQRIDDATKELRSSNEKLHRLDVAKDEFVSMASHQLRTPLTSVKGYISMVLEGDAGKISDMQAKLLGEAFTSSERMVHLINDFLNVSRLQTGKFMLDRRQIDLADLVKQEVDSLQTTAKARNIKLQYRQPSVFPILYLDEGKLRQVVMNFIDNAFYYSREFSSVTIKAARDGADVVVTVQDSGMGVPESEQKQLFTKFFRATNARKQRPDGTGVGLFLAKKVIVAHGGTIIFESVEGKGSTFGFRLPIKKLSLAPADGADQLNN